MEIVTSATGEYDVKHDVIIQQQFTLATKIGSMTSEHSLHQQPGCLAYIIMQLMQLDLAQHVLYMFCLAYTGLCNVYCGYIYVNFQLGNQLKMAQSTELHCL